MTTVCLFCSKTDLNTILACLGVRCIGDGRGHKIFVAQMGGGVAVLSVPNFL